MGVFVDYKKKKKDQMKIFSWEYNNSVKKHEKNWLKFDNLTY